MIFKFRHRLEGAHVHVRVFAGTNPAALGKAGELTFRMEEWATFKRHVLDRAIPDVLFVDDTLAPPTDLPLDWPPEETHHG